jgi:hypothetical protein
MTEKKHALPTAGGRTIVEKDGTRTVHTVAPGMAPDHPCIAYPWPPKVPVEIDEVVEEEHT